MQLHALNEHTLLNCLKWKKGLQGYRGDSSVNIKKTQKLNFVPWQIFYLLACVKNTQGNFHYVMWQIVQSKFFK